ncbi:transcription elongation factor GreAB [Paenimyroides tangerinum]|uniref:Transcription elongation factor GreAB n=1 Tax=Paenimyroides tangerinum TaxID=2488728 RepID=A0A3P3W026_9FLAO|nr:GreA/GreB family elongation factor [Paenimyroides tangerinum]RRJ88114.1 transcription elongation factor GreAB [Paenimyroides tangerinum]
MSENIVLTTGVYDLIKDHIRRRRTTKAQEEILINELKKAKQVVRRELPEDIVTLNKLVTVKNINSNEILTVTFVSPDKAKPNKNKPSILSELGIAIVGYKVGDIISWPSNEGEIKYEILKVDSLHN